MRIFIACFLFSGLLWAQMPDQLSTDFHKERRAAFRAKMPKNTIAVFFTNPVRNRANDVDYVYHPDPNFYYLTGYKEPNGVLIILSETQENGMDELLYVQERDPKAEQWNGKRLGVEGAKKQLQFEHVFPAKDFLKHQLGFPVFDEVTFFPFEDDIRKKRDPASLYYLVEHFKNKISYPKNYNQARHQLYNLILSTPIENAANVAKIIGKQSKYSKAVKNDLKLQDYANNKKQRKEIKEKIALQMGETNINTQRIQQIMNELRETKTKEEMYFLRKAIEISAVGQIEVMKAMHPGMSETEIQGIHEFVYKKYGSEYEGYPSIVGAGHNGCILHYIDNNKPQVNNELVLMDLGAEYRGYTADVTRTIPANGKFSPEQKAIYELVLKAQDAGIKAAKVGAAFWAPNRACNAVINQGLYELGIISSPNQKHAYLPHGVSHYLGLDVHDAGTYGPFKEQTVITVEPGIYIPAGSDCDKKWWDIAVRIEDDILITKKGPVNLSARAPRTVKEIEATMALDSPLDHFHLPELKQ
ncbi:MAG: aminopeptidase P N-terminal domain-containing protein [Flavobacteriaceae bacterium]|nr:aminopeptidase P N-terminal domain-containing protein [Flavobacteriaceae bacterium]